jgi:hypothetical protein
VASGGVKPSEAPKLKSPGRDEATIKDLGILGSPAEPERTHTSTFVRGGSSSRRAVASSRATIPTEVTDSARTLTNKMTPISLRPPGIQRSSPVTAVEPKQMVPKPHLSPNRDYDTVLRGFDCIALDE